MPLFGPDADHGKALLQIANSPVSCLRRAAVAPRTSHSVPYVCSCPLLQHIDWAPCMPEYPSLGVEGVIVAPTLARLLIPTVKSIPCKCTQQ